MTEPLIVGTRVQVVVDGPPFRARRGTVIAILPDRSNSPGTDDTNGYRIEFDEPIDIGRSTYYTDGTGLGQTKQLRRVLYSRHHIEPLTLIDRVGELDDET